jgi:molybdate transport system substrate-binding protein
MNPLHLLSAGAAQALATGLQDRFLQLHGQAVAPTFGAVGVMKDKLLAGAPCDVLILTDALITQLTADGHLRAGTAQPLGVVKTGVAVKNGQARPAVSTPAELKAALLAATGIYIADPVKSTAGIHFMKVLKALGLEQSLANTLRPYPNGAAAMTALAASNEAGLIGCTQNTEILFIDGVELIANLPPEFELATVYTAAIGTQAQSPEAAAQFIALLAGTEAAALRATCGFEV